MSDSLERTEKVSVETFAKKLQLEIIYDSGKEICLTTDNVSRPGLLLSGYYDYFGNERVQVIGQTEYSYLNTLDTPIREQRFDRLCAGNIPCLIFTRDLKIEPYVAKHAKKYGVPVFLSKWNTTTLVSRLNSFLADLLAPQTQLHAVLMDIYGVGVLIKGDSGIGKSETALELVKRGHRLVSDDVVLLKKVNEDIIGTSPEVIRHFMEVRGIGIIDIRSLYGASALQLDMRVELIVDLEKWDTSKQYERVGDKETFETILGVPISRYVIPVTPGRNMGIILETAAAAQRLRNLGYNAGAELEKRLTKRRN